MKHKLNNAILRSIFKVPAGLTKVFEDRNNICVNFYVPKVINSIDLDNSITDPNVKIPVGGFLFIKEFSNGEIILCDNIKSKSYPDALYILHRKYISVLCGMYASNGTSERLVIKNANVVQLRDNSSSISLTSSKKDAVLIWSYTTSALWNVNGIIYTHRSNNAWRIVFTLDGSWPKNRAKNDEELKTFIRYEIMAVSNDPNKRTVDVHVLRAFGNSRGTCTDNIDAIDIEEFVKYVIGRKVQNVYYSVKKEILPAEEESE